MAALTRVTASPSSGQQSTSSTSVPEYKYSTPVPPGIASPDTVETRFGTLKFFDGVPDQASTEKIYDNLDFQRAVQAYLLALPVVNQMGNREAILSVGPVNTTVPERGHRLYRTGQGQGRQVPAAAARLQGGRARGLFRHPGP